MINLGMDDITKKDRQLLEKSIEAYILALETINRLSITYRIETFTFLMCNAWEILLKAKILKDGGNIIREDGKSFSLEGCLRRIYKDNEPIRKNIEVVIGIRNEATHLIIGLIPKEILAVFQTNVINYHKRLKEWFNISLSDRVSVGMMTIVFDFEQRDLDFSSVALQNRLGVETALYLAKLQKEIHDEWESLERSSDFSIGFNFTLALIEKTEQGDIVLTPGVNGDRIGIVLVAKDSADTHPFRQKEAILNINSRLDGLFTINQHHIQWLLKAYNIPNRNEFYHKSKLPGNQTPQYSQAFVDWVVEHYNKDNTFFDRAYKKAEEMRRKKENLINASKDTPYEETIDVLLDDIPDFTESASIQDLEGK